MSTVSSGTLRYQWAVTEERKATIDGPVSLITRLKVAALDGLESALDSIASVVLVVLRAGPSFALWGGLAAVAWLVVRRLRSDRHPRFGNE